MVNLLTLKVRTYQKLKERGVSMGQIAETLEEILEMNKDRLSKMGYETEVKSSDIQRFVGLAFENERLLQSALVGIEADELAEKGKFREPLLSMIRAGKPWVSVNETLILGALDLDGVEEYVPIVKNKSGVIASLDKSNNRVHAFMCNIISGFVAQAFGHYLKEQNEKVHAKEKYRTGKRLSDTSPEEISTKIEERFPLTEDVFTEQFPPLGKLSDDIKSYDPRMLKTEVVTKAAVNQQRERKINFKALGEVSYRMQRSSIQTLTLKVVKKMQRGVVLGKHENYEHNLFFAEMDRLFQSGELSHTMMELMKDKKHFHPPRIAARQAAANSGLISISDFDTLSNEVKRRDFFDQRLLDWFNDPRNVFMPEAVKLNCYDQ